MRPLTLAAILAVTAMPSGDSPRFTTEQLAPGVWRIAAVAGPGFGGDPSSLVIEGRTGTIVVDAQFSASSSEQVIALVRGLTRAPVRWLVNTHWHDDHVSGNAAWKRAYPLIEIIAHDSMAADLPAAAATNRSNFLRSAPGTASFLSSIETRQVGIDGQATDSTELRAFAAYRELIGRFVAESLATAPTRPDRVVGDSSLIDLGERTVVLRYLGRAHTRGDLAVLVPDAGVLGVGDIIAHPIPLVGTTAFPRDYAATILRLLSIPHRMIVPGHGPVLRSDEYPIQMASMLNRLATQVDSLRRAGQPVDSVKRRVDLSEERRTFSGNSRLLNELFTAYVLQPAVVKAYADGAAAEAPTRP